ncbi:DDE_5 domain-containing protein [Azospirillaceae bacterium]
MDITGWMDELAGLHNLIGDCFLRKEPRERALEYLKGLLGSSERKNSWQLAEQAGEKVPYGMQRLLRVAQWDADGVRDILQSYVKDRFGFRGGALVVDETGFVKKGRESAGVKRQYCGSVGKVENCQVGVFLYYAAESGGGAFVDRELYLPEDWIEDWERCDDAGVPKDTPFRTKPDQARLMLDRARQVGFEPAWTLGDSVYGSDPMLRRALENWGWSYVMAIKTTEPVRPQAGQGLITRTALEVVSTISADRWQRISAGEGAKGPRVYDWAEEPLIVPGVETGNHTLLVRRSLNDCNDIALFLVFTTQATPLQEMVRAAGLRWTIEVGFEGAKGEVGLDHYEVRQWTAWYRHITLALLAYAFLAVVKAQTVAAEKKA